MDKQAQAQKLSKLLKERYPAVLCPLNHSAAHELLIATMMSAQTTDKQVNIVTATLFDKYKTVADFAAADIEDIKQIIRSVNFYQNKAKNIVKAFQIITSEFGGKVPDTMEELITLPGVARKTASVVLYHWYGKSAGFTVDTHVLRLTKWFGLTEHTDPAKVERDMMELFPQSDWGDTSLRLIFLGRELLTARNPHYLGTAWEEFMVNYPG